MSSKVINALEIDRIGINERGEKPWHKLKGESVANFRLFETYLSLGPDRTLRSAYEKHTGKSLAKGQSVAGQWSAASSEYEWVRRSDAYDYHVMEGRLKNQEMWHKRYDYKSQQIVDVMQRIASKSVNRLEQRIDDGEDIPTREIVQILSSANAAVAAMRGTPETQINVQNNINFDQARVMADQFKQGAVSAEDAVAEYMRLKDEARNTE